MRWLVAMPGLVLAACSSPPPPPVFVPPIAVEIAPSVPEPASTRSSQPARASAVSDVTPSEVELALKGWSDATQCSDFDYFPQGGIRSFWCHRPPSVTLATIRALAGVDIFVPGPPHPVDGLALDAPSSFGRYNPAFVRWLGTSLPNERGSLVQKATQASYDKNVAPLAEIFWKTLQKAHGEASCFTKEQTAYGDLIVHHKLPKSYYERWFWFMNPFFCSRGLKGGDSFYYDNAFDGGVDGNVAKTVIGFWLRRSLDGTMESFAEALKTLITTYQPALLATGTRSPDPTDLTRALDAASKAAEACKPSRPGPATHQVAVTVFADGHVEAKASQTGGPRASIGRLLPPAPRPGAAQLTCIEAAFAAQRVTAFDGSKLGFNRTITLR